MVVWVLLCGRSVGGEGVVPCGGGAPREDMCREELNIVRWKGTTVKNFGEEGQCACIYIRSGGGLTPWQEPGGFGLE